MGTTLQNGVYLPNEGERNCYAGLKTNWEILDQKVADVTALQQAVAGALHREIVESLPTTDIDPNTIYMVLSGTSATENVYNEFMYVNNAWELIGTSATDLTNYYTKAEVDGKLLLKASASDLTSHTGDATIHVTASDKSKWNTVALIKQLRLVNTQVGSATSIAFANIDDTNGIKVGDKCMDLDGKLFEITAVDTTNQTVTVGTALIDLALDGNVVHTSGDETVGGQKTFSNRTIFSTTSVNGELTLRQNAYDPATNGQSALSSTCNFNINARSVTNGGFAGIGFYGAPGFTTTRLNCRYYTGANESEEIWVECTVSGTSGSITGRSFKPSNNGLVDLGTNANRWKSVYATNYYYGNDNVEFSTKFVTTDTNQTISGSKTFADLVVYNSDTTAYASYLSLKNQRNARGSSETGVQGIQYLDKNGKTLTMLESRVISNGNTGFNIICYNIDGNNQSVSDGVSVIKSPTTTNFAPTTDNAVTCGRALAKWSDVQTYKVNGLTPSSLGMPSDRSARIDISGYFTNTGIGNTNDYSVPANGFIFLNLLNAFAVICYSIDETNNVNYAQSYLRPVDGQIYILFPVRKNDIFRTLWTANGGTITVTGAYFIPCQGNI